MSRKVFVEELAERLGRSVATIRTYATRPEYQHLLPPLYRLTGAQRIFALEHELEEFEQSVVRVKVRPQRRGPGRPTKAEQRRRRGAEQ